MENYTALAILIKEILDRIDCAQIALIALAWKAPEIINAIRWW